MSPTNSGPERFATIVADPPWEHPDGFVTRSRTPGKWTGPAIKYGLPYPSMSVTEISQLPVKGFAARDCRTFLWTTNRYLPDSFDVLEAWGFSYKQTLTWDKPDALNGSVAPNSEFIVVGVKGNPKRLTRLSRAVVTHAQTKQHSRKPEVFLDLVEQVSPGPYLELFARRNRLGWQTWGNESLEHVEIA